MEHEWMSPEFKALFGYEDHEIENNSEWWQTHIFPEDLERALQNFTDHVEKGVPFSLVVRYRHKNGSTVWVRCRGLVQRNSEGKPIRMLGAHNDLTQLMQTQEELKKKNDVLDMLCNTSLDGFWDWNIKTGEKFLSTRWKNALGYEESELENTLETYLTLILPEDIPKAFAARKRHMDEGAPYSVVLRFKRKDGSMAHMLAQGIATKDKRSGQWTRMYGTFTDVSYLEETRAARSANEAKSVFLRTMSHEIRTPLNAILGMAQVLMGTSLDVEQRDCLSTLHNSGKHLLCVISDILDFSQIESGNLNISNAQFNVQATVRDVVAALQSEADTKDIVLTFDSSVTVGAKFVGDRERTRQVVFNLVGNAIKFTKQGAVTVSIDIGSENDDDENSLMGVRVKVHDTGCGMTPSQQAIIFDDFTQASPEIKHRFGGSGLGLRLVFVSSCVCVRVIVSLPKRMHLSIPQHLEEACHCNGRLHPS
jgi:two-component system, sensor histidine kinase and response regulator